MATRRGDGYRSAPPILRALLRGHGLICPPWQIKSAPLAAANQRDGQITSDFPKSCQAPKSKIFLFSLDPNQFTDSCRPVPTRGAARDRHERGAGGDGRWQRARRMRPAGVRPSRVGLAPQCRRQVWRIFREATVSNKRGHRGEREVSRKTIARGMPGLLRCTCGDYARVLFSFAREAAGALGTRHSLRPLISGRTVVAKPRAYRAARMRKHVFWMFENGTGNRGIRERPRPPPPPRGCGRRSWRGRARCRRASARRRRARP
jgi:hypothetical protein